MPLHLNIWQKQNRNIHIEIIKNLLKLIIPENPFSFFRRLKDNNKKLSFSKKIELYLIRTKIEKIRILNCIKLSYYVIKK